MSALLRRHLRFFARGRPPDASPRRFRAFSTYEHAENGKQSINGKRTWYDVLGVPRDAERSFIRKRYLELVKKNHPDKIKHTVVGATVDTSDLSEPTSEEEQKRLEDESSAKFAQIAEAYDCLSNVEKRQRYDHYLETGVGLDQIKSRADTAEVYRKQYALWEKHKKSEQKMRGERPLIHEEMWNWKWWVNWDQGMPLVGPMFIIIVFGIGSYYQSCVIMSRNPAMDRENLEAKEGVNFEDEAEMRSVAEELSKVRPYRAAELDRKEKDRQVNPDRNSVSYNLVYEQSVEGKFAKQSDEIHVVRKPHSATEKFTGYPEKIHVVSNIPWIEDEIFTRAKREWWNERRPTYKSEPIYLSEDGKPTTFVIWFTSIPDMKGRSGWFLTSKKFLHRHSGRYPLAFNPDNYAADPARIRGAWYIWDAKNKKFKSSSKVDISKITEDDELDLRKEKTEEEAALTAKFTTTELREREASTTG